jgi:branched-chain amino acid transport system ATP-binding protein
MLEIKDLKVSYGAIQALKGVSLTVGEGKIVTLIGANGAGKSTLLRAISGLIRVHSGSVHFMGRPLAALHAYEVVRAGLSHCPEGRRIFPELTVFENLELGAHFRKDRDAVKADLYLVFHIFPRLRERLRQPAGTLSGGEQQMLAIGRALMSRPRLLMLDEPSLGIAPILVQEIFKTIAEINEKQKMTILLVEQNANQALKLAHDAYVLETGKVVLSGPASQLAADPRIKAAYLGS